MTFTTLCIFQDSAKDMAQLTRREKQRLRRHGLEKPGLQGRLFLATLHSVQGRQVVLRVLVEGNGGGECRVGEG